jgi:2,3-bisphosphoglycerate-dependent phosphoglycerate mutase
MSTPRRFSQVPYEGPPGSTELLLVRHGASADAVEGEEFEFIDGHGNPPLSDIGREQAELVGARLAHLAIDALYVTTLRRTVETAAPLVRRTGLTPVVEPDLREVNLGEWEGGLFRQKVADADPMAMRMMQEERWDVVPGAESPEEFGGRIQRAIERIKTAHPDGRVVAFSHGAAIGEVLAQAAGSRPFAFLMSDNTAIARLVLTAESSILRGFNDTAHLYPWTS